MDNTALTLATLATVAFAVVSVPAASAEPSDVLAASPCKPYPRDPTVYDEAWCTAKGIGNATRILVDNIYDGNYTTLQDYFQGVMEWKRAVQSCAREFGNSTYCPNIAIRFS